MSFWKGIHKGNKTSKKVYKILSQIFHLNLDQSSRQSNNLNDKTIKEKDQDQISSMWK